MRLGLLLAAGVLALAVFGAVRLGGASGRAG
jgi:hypothetical protein